MTNYQYCWSNFAENEIIAICRANNMHRLILSPFTFPYVQAVLLENPLFQPNAPTPARLPTFSLFPTPIAITKAIADDSLFQWHSTPLEPGLNVFSLEKNIVYIERDIETGSPDGPFQAGWNSLCKLSSPVNCADFSIFVIVLHTKQYQQLG